MPKLPPDILPPEPKQPQLEGTCASCQTEIYADESYLHYLANDQLACGTQCLAEYLKQIGEVEEVQ